MSPQPSVQGELSGSFSEQMHTDIAAALSLEDDTIGYEYTFARVSDGTLIYFAPQNKINKLKQKILGIVSDLGG